MSQPLPELSSMKNCPSERPMEGFLGCLGGAVFWQQTTGMVLRGAGRGGHRSGGLFSLPRALCAWTCSTVSSCCVSLLGRVEEASKPCTPFFFFLFSNRVLLSPLEMWWCINPDFGILMIFTVRNSDFLWCKMGIATLTWQGSFED